ncbi:MAG: response regulator transcription factor [Chloroflexi bacterium]|nr:response regulator transcription factor [Chloroflexota bacterium]
MARVKALLRRAAERNKTKSQPLKAGNLSICLDEKRVTNTGKDIALTPNEYKVLCLLVINAGKTMTQEQLMTEVWGSNSRRSHGVLRMTVCRLRNKLRDDPRSPRLISTVSGVGYAFMQPVQ